MEDQKKPVSDVQQEPQVLTVRTNSLEVALDFLRRAHADPHMGAIHITLDSPGGFTGGESEPEWLEPTICIGFNPLPGRMLRGSELKMAVSDPWAGVEPMRPAMISAQEMWREVDIIRGSLPIFELPVDLFDLLPLPSEHMRISIKAAQLEIDKLGKSLAKENYAKQPHASFKKARNRVISNPKYC